jgi:protein dithiol:quinone oxidoreductase
MKSIRRTCLLGLLICAGVLAFSMYLQMDNGLTPCPLCDLQRMAFALLFLIFLFAAVQSPARTGALIYLEILSLLTIAGAVLAGRQIWLQHQPPGSVAECGFGLNYLFQSLPFFEAMQTAFNGSSQCAAVDWQLLGLSMADWSMVVFVVLFLLISASMIRVLKSPRR